MHDHIYDNICQVIGNTPVVRLARIPKEGWAEMLVKLESFNPGGSVKDRIGLSMIEAAERAGKLKPGGTIVEPTSGNTGIGLAMVAAAKGYKAILVMPETMSVERRNLLRAYGADLVLTPGAEGMNGAVRRAEELAAQNPTYFIPQQFKNQANVKIHRETTGPEIVEAIKSYDGKLDAFVAGIGTGGTISGAGEVLKQNFPNIKVVAVEPAASPLLSGGGPGPHTIQVIGANFIPEILNREIYDQVIPVENDEAFETARTVAKKEGLLVGISSGAAIFAALKVAKELGEGKRVVAIVPSNGERY